MSKYFSKSPGTRERYVESTSGNGQKQPQKSGVSQCRCPVCNNPDLHQSNANARTGRFVRSLPAIFYDNPGESPEEPHFSGSPLSWFHGSGDRLLCDSGASVQAASAAVPQGPARRPCYAGKIL